METECKIQRLKKLFWLIMGTYNCRKKLKSLKEKKKNIYNYRQVVVFVNCEL